MGGGPATAKTADYVLVAADAGTTVAMNAAGATTITVNTGLFAAGDTVFIQNLGAGACTVTAGTATVATAGSLILPQNDAGILYFTSASAAIFYDYIQVGATSPLTTKGDLYTYSTSDTRLGVGADGTTLVADSAEATGLKWVTPAGGGKVLQVVQDTETTGVSSSTSSYVDTGLSVSITPSSATSKVLVFVNGTCTKTADNVNTRLEIRLQRDATTAQEIHTSPFYTHSTPIRFRGMFNSAYLDSPATTSAITYKVQINAGGSHSSVTACDIGTSTIIAMEIGA
jgi:hypothetical protein